MKRRLLIYLLKDLKGKHVGCEFGGGDYRRHSRIVDYCDWLIVTLGDDKECEKQASE